MNRRSFFTKLPVLGAAAVMPSAVVPAPDPERTKRLSQITGLEVAMRNLQETMNRKISIPVHIDGRKIAEAAAKHLPSIIEGRF